MDNKRLLITRLNVWYDPAMEQILSAQPGFELRTCVQEGDEELTRQSLRQSHVYQIPSARDEVCDAWVVSKAFLRHCPQLLCVSVNGAGYDTVDVPACTEAGVMVVNQSGANAQSVAEATIALMLDVSRRVSESDRLIRHKRGFSREYLMGREISGKTLGLIGFGNIGKKVSVLAQAFGMQVLVFDPYVDAAIIHQMNGESVDFDELLKRSDFVSLHCPRNPSTLNMFDEQAISKMKPGAIFINTARGGIHNETALFKALKSGHLSGAGIDVWDQEPPPLDHPLLSLESVVATFHTAGVTVEARRNMATWAAEQIVAVLQGAKPARCINPEVWPKFRERYEKTMGTRAVLQV